MPRFERKQNIFANKDALGESYHPDRIEERDEEIAEYEAALQPVIDGWEPNNVFLYGNTGVGKTAVTSYLLNELQTDIEDYDDVDLTVVQLNCKPLSSSYQVAVGLVNKLRPHGGEISTTGYPQQAVFEKLFRELDKIGGTILLVLDEIDAIGDKDDILYELPRARANNKLTDTKVGVIGISNDFKFRDRLDRLYNMQGSETEDKKLLYRYILWNLVSSEPYKGGKAVVAAKSVRTQYYRYISRIFAFLLSLGFSMWVYLHLEIDLVQILENVGNYEMNLGDRLSPWLKILITAGILTAGSEPLHQLIKRVEKRGREQKTSKS